jgi:NAD(P)-dependent dehydrogenase (short-subunit alcohol dehydrogenase family)
MKLFDLSGEVAVCIGAGGALAGAIAHGFGEAGAKVAVVDLRLEAAEVRAKEINAHGGVAKAFQANAMEKESLQKAHDAIVASLGGPTVLLNAAGGNDPKTTVTADNPFEAIPLENWKRNFDLNLVAGDGPLPVANHLYFLMPGGFDIQFHQHVFVITDAGGFHFVENFSHHLGGAGRFAYSKNSLPFSAATADRLQAYPVFRKINRHFGHCLGQGVAQLIDRIQIQTAFIRGRKHQVSLVLEADRFTGQPGRVDVKVMFCHQCL